MGNSAVFILCFFLFPTEVPNMTSVFHLLPSCPGCLVFSIKSNVKNGRQIFRLMKLDSADVPDEIHARSLYLLGKERTSKRKIIPCLTSKTFMHFCFVSSQHTNPEGLRSRAFQEASKLPRLLWRTRLPVQH